MATDEHKRVHQGAILQSSTERASDLQRVNAARCSTFGIKVRAERRASLRPSAFVGVQVPSSAPIQRINHLQEGQPETAGLLFRHCSCFCSGCRNFCSCLYWVIHCSTSSRIQRRSFLYLNAVSIARISGLSSKAQAVETRTIELVGEGLIPPLMTTDNRTGSGLLEGTPWVLCSLMPYILPLILHPCCRSKR